MVGDVVESKRKAMAGQDVPDRDAEGGPRKLDEGEHGTYMTEAKRNRKVQEDNVARTASLSAGDLNQSSNKHSFCSSVEWTLRG
jgi:hypothetical protein